MGRGGAVDRRVEAELNQPRQEADVVDVGVGEQHPVDRLGVEGGGLPVPEPQLLLALEEPGVQQHAGAVVGQQVLRAGHRTGGSVEGDLELGHGGSSGRCRNPGRVSDLANTG